jgi:imidazolonepropionase-like amidohydrolase
MFLTRAGEIPRGFQPIAKRLPPQVRRGLLSSGLTPPPGMDDRYRKSFAKMVELVGMMYRAGIPIEDGTDSMPGFSYHRELELDVMAGIPPEKVLQDATLNSARIMNLDRDLGSIAPGKLADLALVDGDPVANISDTEKDSARGERRRLVLAGGTIFRAGSGAVTPDDDHSLPGCAV